MHFYMRSKKNLIGKTYGNLIVISEAESKISPSGQKQTRWKCKCSCGSECTQYYKDLVRRSNISCGCNRGKHRRKFEPILSSARRIWHANYSDGDLNFDDFIILTAKPCHYCGSPPSNSFTFKHGATFIYSGLDRVDSSLPHNLSNCVPCCKRCNLVKSNRSLTDFLSWVEAIYNNCIK